MFGTPPPLPPFSLYLEPRVQHQIKPVLLQWCLSAPFFFQSSFKRFFTQVTSGKIAVGLNTIRKLLKRLKLLFTFSLIFFFFSFMETLTLKYLYSYSWITFSAKDATFYIGRRPELKDTISFGLIHQGWYLTASDKVGDSWKTTAAFDNHTSEFALESSFIAVPYAMNDNPYKNCDTIGPQEPEQPEIPSIPVQPLPPTVPEKPTYPSGPPGSNHRF